MKRIIFDENIPRQLKRAFGQGCFVTTVQEQEMASLKNGRLLAQLEGNFDVFVTADKNLRYQQNLAGRTLAIVELPTNRRPLLQGLFPGSPLPWKVLRRAHTSWCRPETGAPAQFA